MIKADTLRTKLKDKLLIFCIYKKIKHFFIYILLTIVYFIVDTSRLHSPQILGDFRQMLRFFPL
ncbi:hypothetical protein JCM18901_1361 [Psychrobacter sp. JCM 18901]|nr:hypothetical protein JCM18901_1361 [Psychrobacter sp. JCM 18901]